MKKISHRTYVDYVEHRRNFDWEGERDWGFSFACDAAGEVDVDALNPCARENYLACLTGVVDGRKIVDRGVQSWERTVVEPAIGLCDVCGSEVVLEGFTCTCERCGADYNSAGQRLAPRSQWGEETGESVADILSVDYGADCDW